MNDDFFEGLNNSNNNNNSNNKHEAKITRDEIEKNGRRKMCLIILLGPVVQSPIKLILG